MKEQLIDSLKIKLESEHGVKIQTLDLFYHHSEPDNIRVSIEILNESTIQDVLGKKDSLMIRKLLLPKLKKEVSTKSGFKVEELSNCLLSIRMEDYDIKIDVDFFTEIDSEIVVKQFKYNF